MNKKISIGVSLFLMAITATVTFAITWVFSSGVFNGMLNTNVTITKAMYDKIDEIDKIVRENYNGEIDETLLLDSISKGYAYGLGDFYANYYSAEEYSELKDDLNGKVVGIGVDHVKDAEGYARITSVYEDSPAQIAGLQKNDQIVKISDIDVLTDYNNAVNAL